MTLDFSKRGKVKVRMDDCVNRMLNEFPVKFKEDEGCKTPASNDLLLVLTRAREFPTKPFQNRPYLVPKSHEAVFKKTIDEMVQWGILEKCGPMDYLSPTFIVPKKDGRVRFVSDFWQLNEMIKRKVWLLPRIQDILKKRNGYNYFSKLDLSLFFYTFEMDKAYKDLCGIVTPFGNYRYTRLPMGIKQSPDIAQAHIE
ncbi:unnamed protein product [Cylindrotheca closterium]|uniref:Reverse transcriptase domain-containing protein n=1 Tax=Cylindrotheca closterium TaxID=2856 RepID=A0AAD2FE38_9STRA|nr:unnamed protein product [Cylindrotheca closterium]